MLSTIVLLRHSPKIKAHEIRLTKINGPNLKHRQFHLNHSIQCINFKDLVFARGLERESKDLQKSLTLSISQGMEEANTCPTTGKY